MRVKLYVRHGVHPDDLLHLSPLYLPVFWAKLVGSPAPEISPALLCKKFKGHNRRPNLSQI